MNKKEKEKALERLRELGEQDYVPYYDGNDYRTNMIKYRKLVLYFVVTGYITICLTLYSGFKLMGRNDFNYYLNNYSGDLYQVRACKLDEAPYCNSDNIKTRLVE